MKIKRVYHHYEKWEDFKNGMYRNVRPQEQEYLIECAACLLSDPIQLKKAMVEVTENWQISAEENLSNAECNRRAWLGQAACCFECKVPEDLTRLAWGTLNDEQRIKANAVATQVIETWGQTYISKQTNIKQGTIF